MLASGAVTSKNAMGALLCLSTKAFRSRALSESIRSDRSDLKKLNIGICFMDGIVFVVLHCIYIQYIRIYVVAATIVATRQGQSNRKLQTIY